MDKLIVGFDFDRTLAHFQKVDGVKNPIDLLIKSGFSQKEAAEVYGRTRASGFSIERFISESEEVRNIDSSKLEVDLKSWVSYTLSLYSDVHEIHDHLESKGIDWCIITFGNRTFQRMKIENVDLHPPLILHTDAVGRKWQPICKLLNEYDTVVFVDDSEEELRAIASHKNCNVKLLLLDRDDIRTDSNLDRISSLLEIKEVI
jgi:phosphoglycolate phosphatase-like HAD superfamily hydrolase